jgi:hypothetical protein
MRIRKLAVALSWIAASEIVYGAQPPIVIVVPDQVGIQELALKEAMESAQRTFKSAGVETDWDVCRVATDTNEPCTLPAPGSYLKAIFEPDWAATLALSRASRGDSARRSRRAT